MSENINDYKIKIVLINGYIYNYMNTFKYYNLNLPDLIKKYIENNFDKFKYLFLFQKEMELFELNDNTKIIFFCKSHSDYCSNYCKLLQNKFSKNLYKIYSDIEKMLNDYPEVKYSQQNLKQNNIITTTKILPSQIYENLFLGDELFSFNEDFIKEKNIKNILTLLETSPCKLSSNPNYSYINFKYININDDYYTKISDYFEECIEFIKKAHNNNEIVYVNCAKGISRSVSIIIAFLIKEKKMSFAEAFTYVKQCRSIAQPNYYFITQLLDYEKYYIMQI